MSERKYTFIVEWFDPTASILKQFYFTYYLPGKQIEMVISDLYTVWYQESENLFEKDHISRYFYWGFVHW